MRFFHRQSSIPWPAVLSRQSFSDGGNLRRRRIRPLALRLLLPTFYFDSLSSRFALRYPRGCTVHVARPARSHSAFYFPFRPLSSDSLVQRNVPVSWPEIYCLNPAGFFFILAALTLAIPFE